LRRCVDVDVSFSRLSRVPIPVPREGAEYGADTT
jgi:hypothetical protein